MLVPAVASAPVVPLATTRAATILILVAWGALDPVDVDGIGSLDLGGGPATLGDLDLDQHQCVVLVVLPPAVVLDR